MQELDVLERARYRFVADRLPVSKHPILVLRERDGDDGLDDTLEADTLIIRLARDTTPQEAEELAGRLNEKVIGVAAVGTAG